MPAYTSGSLTGSNLEIGIALVLQDRFSNQAREASSQIKRLHNEAKMAVTANLQSAKSMADTVMGWSGRALGGISSMLQEGAGFVDTMTTVKAITAATDTQMKLYIIIFHGQRIYPKKSLIKLKWLLKKSY